VPSFKVKFSGVTILQGVEISIFLLIFEWALQQCSATALPVSGIYHCTECRWNRCSSSDNRQVLIFNNEFCLKIPIHVPKMDVLFFLGGGLCTVNVEQPNHDPKGHFLAYRNT